MRVDNNISLFVGEQPGSSFAMDGTGKKQENRKSIFAGNMFGNENSLQDRIAQKKKDAQEKAMKVVKDAFEGDQAVSDELNSLRDKIVGLKEDNKRLNDELAGINTRREDLEKAYEAGEISKEDYVTEKANLREELQQRLKERDENDSKIVGLGRAIYDIGIESLKHHYMADAQDQAEQIMDAARDEIVGMAVEAGMDHIDEEAEERAEKAEKIKEEREEQEERVEEQKEHLEEKEERVERQRENNREEEELLEDMLMDEMITFDQAKSDVQSEVQDILRKMKLIEEDIKGAVVDQNL